jgi:hypothetical protein
VTEKARIIGADELSSSLHRAAGEIGDMSRAGERAGRLVANRGRVEVPRRTGALSASIGTRTSANTTEVTSGLAYSNRTHWGYSRYGQRAQPFLLDPATQLVPTWAGYYTDEADRILHTVRGA